MCGLILFTHASWRRTTIGENGCCLFTVPSSFLSLSRNSSTYLSSFYSEGSLRINSWRKWRPWFNILDSSMAWGDVCEKMRRDVNPSKVDSKKTTTEPYRRESSLFPPWAHFTTDTSWRKNPSKIWNESWNRVKIRSQLTVKKKKDLN